MTTDEIEGFPEVGTFCHKVFPAREDAVEMCLRIMHRNGHAHDSAVFLEEITDAERARLDHPGNRFSLLPDMPDGVSNFIALANMVNR